MGKGELNSLMYSFSFIIGSSIISCLGCLPPLFLI